MADLKTREQIDIKDTWDLKELCPSDEIWEEEYKKLDVQCEKIKNWKGKVFETPASLNEFLNLYVESGISLGKVYVYAHQKYHEDTANSVYQGLSERATMLLMKYQMAI